MGSIRMRQLSTFVLALSIATNSLSAYSCTTIVVGKHATVDGSIIIARNEDTDGADDPQNMTRTPPRQAASLFVSNSIQNSNNNRFNWEMPPNALGYLAFPNWQSLGKSSLSFEETGINDDGVAISATETIFNSEAALKADPYLASTGVTEDAVTSVVLPYATSAKEGVRLLGRVIERAGAGEGFGVAFSDRNEAWYLETASGHHWLAMRIPDNSFFISSNQGRLQQADLGDTMNAMASPGLIEFATKNGLYDPKLGEFNFFKCCISNTEHDKTYNYPRVKTLLQQLGGVTYEPDDGLYPVFVAPANKLSVADVIKALRNHYAGTVHDPYQQQNPKEPDRPVSVLRASLSHVTQTRPNLPDDIAMVQYIALGLTDLAAYIPFYKGLAEIPPSYQGATGSLDHRATFWKYRKLQTLVMQDYPRLASGVHEAIANFEKSVADRQIAMEGEYLDLVRKDGAAARALIQAFTNSILTDQDALLAELTARLTRDLGLKNLTDQQMEQLIKDTEKRYHFHGA